MIPQQDKNYVRSKNCSSGDQASSQASRPSGNVPLNAMALWRCQQNCYYYYYYYYYCYYYVAVS